MVYVSILTVYTLASHKYNLVHNYNEMQINLCIRQIKNGIHMTPGLSPFYVQTQIYRNIFFKQPIEGSNSYDNNVQKKPL